MNTMYGITSGGGLSGSSVRGSSPKTLPRWENTYSCTLPDSTTSLGPDSSIVAAGWGTVCRMPWIVTVSAWNFSARRGPASVWTVPTPS